MRGRTDLAPDVPAGDYYSHCPDHLSIRELVKTRYCIFNGYIHQGYRKVEGEWEITGSHTSGLFVDKQCSRRCQRRVSLWGVPMQSPVFKKLEI
jgi:hypothetical protein